MFDEGVERDTDGGSAEGRLEGGPLGGLPNLWLGRDVWDVDHFQEGSQRNRGGLDRHNAGDSEEAAGVFEHAGSLGRGRDSGRGNEDTRLDVHRIFQNDVRTDIVLEVLIYIPEHSRRDVNGQDRRSGQREKLHPTARQAVVSVSALAPSPSTHGPREGRSGSNRLGGRSRHILNLASRCCNGRGQSTLLRSGGDRRWGQVESLGPFWFLRRYHGLDLRGARTRSLCRSGGGGGGLLRRRAGLSDDLRESSFKRARPTHADG
jgi:hypothetical protein